MNFAIVKFLSPRIEGHQVWMSINFISEIYLLKLFWWICIRLFTWFTTYIFKNLKTMPLFLTLYDFLVVQKDLKLLFLIMLMYIVCILWLSALYNSYWINLIIYYTVLLFVSKTNIWRLLILMAKYLIYFKFSFNTILCNFHIFLIHHKVKSYNCFFRWPIKS